MQAEVNELERRRWCCWPHARLARKSWIFDESNPWATAQPLQRPPLLERHRPFDSRAEFKRQKLEEKKIIRKERRREERMAFKEDKSDRERSSLRKKGERGSLRVKGTCHQRIQEREVKSRISSRRSHMRAPRLRIIRKGLWEVQHGEEGKGKENKSSRREGKTIDCRKKWRGRLEEIVSATRTTKCQVWNATRRVIKERSSG